MPGSTGQRRFRMRMITFAFLALAGFVPLANSQVYVNSWERGSYGYSSGYYGGYGHSGGRVGNIVAGVGIGAGIGYIAGGGRGAAIGGGVGGAVVGLAEYAMHRASRGPKALDCSKKKSDKKCEAALAEAQAEAEMAEREALGKRLYNATRWPVQVQDCGQTVGQLRPRSSMQMLEARCGYVGVILTPDPSTPGRTARYEAAFRLTEDAASGWVFRAPSNLGGAR